MFVWMPRAVLVGAILDATVICQLVQPSGLGGSPPEVR